jgi:CxxC motif-containing protein (DUF1111 family)
MPSSSNPAPSARAPAFRLAAAGLLAIVAVPAIATDLGDPHLPVIARTAEEAARIARVTAPTSDFTRPEDFEGNPAGAATVRATAGPQSFSLPSANLDFAQLADFKLGNAIFTKTWIAAPASTRASDGLGPLFNARACQRCHTKDARGRPPLTPDEAAVALFLRVSIPGDPFDPRMSGVPGHVATTPDPVYGTQLQNFAVAGLLPEYRLGIRYTEMSVALSGGETATLRAPIYTAEDLGYGPLSPDAMLSPRIAPQMIGLGLIEAIPATDILARADEDDADGDGISGKAQIVWSDQFGQPMLGRFGHKAGAPTIRAQSAGAFLGDMGLSTPLHPQGAGECTPAQTACLAAPTGEDAGLRDGLEVDGPQLDLVTFYSGNLGVPARRDPGDARVLRGKAVFYVTGCIACHTPKHVTARLPKGTAQGFQLIWPYTDLLLHDMGEGLADNRPEGRADGREWRTPPLWGIGLTESVAGHSFLLHDGRARNLLEAILWHGGEAQGQRDAVIAMPPDDRAALIRFLESL